MAECLGYLTQLFDFLNHSFEGPEAVPELTSAGRATATVV